ncbi:hypothetical protein Y1Q_0007605 [Alligator mississippiensis]|uniref:DDE Tnp4 domain-containing protein n=1 Tax=Alligator mississippiensis TaxID=8496 RepID=A0A151NCJ4_ALLMI|nr:hypothetical protein Y1Q_0007605 [Alligator mississippiensis]
MTRDTFLDLLEQQDTTMWQPSPTDTQLAITLMKLASLHYVGHLFGMAKVSAGEAILEVCITLQDVLGHTMLCVHNPLAVVVGFQVLGFPQCIRALDGTHIPITCLLHGDHPYYSRRSFHSILL